MAYRNGDNDTHILARRIGGHEYQTYCGHVVDGLSMMLKCCWPAKVSEQKGEAHKGCVMRYLRESGQVLRGG